MSQSKRSYEAAFDTYKRNFMPYWPRAYETLLSVIPEESNLLDVACGIGKMHGYIPEKMKYTGFDYTEHFLDIAREEHPGIKVVHGTVLNLPFEDDEFDYAVCKDLLEHVSPDDVQRAVQEMARVASNGIVISWFKAPGVKAHYYESPQGHITNRYAINWMKKRIMNIGKENMLTITWIRKSQTLWKVDFI